MFRKEERLFISIVKYYICRYLFIFYYRNMHHSAEWFPKLSWSHAFRVSELNPAFGDLESLIRRLPADFESCGQTVHKARNEIKIAETPLGKVMIKSFGKIYLANRFVYAWIRPSKAKRSYRNALLLLKKGIATPPPVAYIERYQKGMLQESMYLYQYSPVSRDIRTVLTDPGYPDREKILQDFAGFTFFLYQQGVYHRDYSPGNILWEKEGDHYDFTLIDINRMTFGKINRHDSYKLFRRLSANEDTLKIIAGKYAKLLGEDERHVTEKIISYTRRFVGKKARKKRLKKALHKLLRS